MGILLLEDGGRALLEDDGLILLEDGAIVGVFGRCTITYTVLNTVTFAFASMSMDYEVIEELVMAE